MSSSSTFFRASRDVKSKLREDGQIAAAIAKSEKEYQRKVEENACDTLATLRGKICPSVPWHTVNENELLIIYCIRHSFEGNAPVMDPVVVIDKELQLNVFIKSAKLNKIFDHHLPASINSLQTVYNILDAIQSVFATNCCTSDLKAKVHNSLPVVLMLILSLLEPFLDKLENYSNTIWFISEQLTLILNKQASYSAQFSIFASLFYNVSPHAYRFLRNSGNCILPSYSTVRRVTLSCSLSPSSEQIDDNFLLYIRSKFKNLLGCDKTVMLLVDKIHLKPYFDYKGGNLVGAAYNSNDAATSAFAFMVNSVFSKFKEVVHVLPARKMDAEALFNLLRKTIIGLEKIGFTVIAIITDNNAINRKAMSLFEAPPKLSIVYKHPVDSSRPLFFVFDAVHLLKCIRNNWINQKTPAISMIYPQFSFDGINSKNSPSNASFESLRLLHGSESDSLLKFAYKLSWKALHPSNLERQNVSYVLHIFNSYVAQSLLLLGEKCQIPHYEDTSAFIRVISTWWSIVNVKTPWKGKRPKNVYEEPLRKGNHISKQFLQYFFEWLSRWKTIESPAGKLTRETYTALQHSTHALLELAEYCFNELGAEYILLGKFQTDSLEARFGQYRQLSGAKYDVSIRQVYEAEKKLRMLSVLQLSLNSKQFTLKNFQEDWKDFDIASETNVTWPCIISEAAQMKANEYIPVITYIAGYCCYSVTKKLQCSHCKNELISPDKNAESFNNSLITGISRGGLLYPCDDVITIVYLNYLVIDNLCASSSFQHSTQQRNIAVETTYSLVVFEDFSIMQLSTCPTLHKYHNIVKMILWVSTNCLLNNFCSLKNDQVTESKMARKRKLATLTK